MRLIRCFGEKSAVEDRIRSVKPDVQAEIANDCLDNVVTFYDIEDNDFYDILEELDDIIYNDADITLEETFVNFLAVNNLMAAVAESCTGGLISAGIVNVSGASKVFYEGVVTYSNQSKIYRLGVSPESLAEFGAVSSEVAKEMAYGLIDDEVDIAISTTGIAGPDGGTPEKPVGLVYIGIAGASLEEPIAIRNIFKGTRSEIRRSAKNASLFYALQFLRKNY
ncbi:MAG TPA: nicotinamide-nucleotide amidohydrolase family protein [Clostridia bacterium]|jgi:nicotinamide-nucleotide amidase|nr:nicotinamide-nucleotide amidohydrolase family protein [Clostridia bacterium]